MITEPIPDHYTCIIDLLCRAGRFEEARNFINKIVEFMVTWKLGNGLADSLIELKLQNPANYVLLSSLNAAKGTWNEVAQLRRGMRDKRVKKEPGYSWIKYKGKVHVFSADDQSIPFLGQIYAELEKLNCKMIEEGYIHDMSYVLHDVEESKKIKMLNHHRFFMMLKNLRR